MSRVYFVGAGSGAADLITVRGYRLIQEADTIIYAGSLVNPEHLEAAKKGCSIYNSAYMNLDEVIDVMKRDIAEGKMVVRLHTGDPSIYGAIREQMDRLDEAGIEFEVCPGVSSFCGAAAAIKKEYTLPDVSQSVILTRMEGRTPVPERESIRNLASHGTSMAIFLSASMTDKLKEELLASGGFKEDTPCAIVYKATWPDEKIIETTVGKLPEAAAENGINRTALILAGDFLGNRYSLSKLYDPSFTTGFRKGTGSAGFTEKTGSAGTVKETGSAGFPKGRDVHDIAIVTYSDQGRQAAFNVAGRLGNCSVFSFGVEFRNGKHLMQEIFDKMDAILFISASGIAVRTVAPFLKDKKFDPAVLVMDDSCNNVISLLSGHIGGANRLALEIAEITGATPVITTATDNRKVFSADSWASENGYRIGSMMLAKKMSAALLRGGEVESVTEKDGSVIFRVKGSEYWKENPLVLVPFRYVIGIGCRKNTPYEKIRSAVDGVLKAENIEYCDVYRICSVDIKEHENGIRRLAREINVPFTVYSADELDSLDEMCGEDCCFESSGFVKKITGTDNVCQRSAFAGSCGGRDITGKVCCDGVTVAVYERKF